MRMMANMKRVCEVAALATAIAAFAGGAAAEAQSPPPFAAPRAPPAPPPPQPSLPKGTPVRIGFAPPLGVPIRYRETETKTANGQPRTEIAELVVRFERSGENYLMEGRVEIPGLPPRLAANPMVKIALMPVTFRLDRDGAFMGVEKEAAYWARLDPIIEQIAVEPDNPPEMATIIRDMFRKMREMPAMERAALVGRKFVPITLNAGFESAVGETVETPMEETSVPLPVANAKLKRAFAITLASANSNIIRIETQTRFDPEDLARLMRQLAELAPAGKRPTELPEMHQTFVHIVSRDTGLVLSSTETSHAGNGPDAPAVKIVRLERLR
jgi:hypothetical protein